MVTSNADSGPGTLRDALTKAAANGQSSVDQIQFNLPGTTEADRTITLLRELPHIKSKTIIDATTQPGFKLGRSDAKVAIRADRSVYANPLLYTGAFFIDDAEDVEIYGFYIYNFYNLINSFPKDIHLKDAGIYIASSVNVTIGAPGKGNVLDGNKNGIYADGDVSLVQSERITIQSNWIGLSPDGTIPAVTTNLTGIYLIAKNSIIGGDISEKGNYVAGHTGVHTFGQIDDAIVFGGPNTVLRFYKLGLDIDGKPSGRVVEFGIYNPAPVSNVLIADNVANVLSFYLHQVKNFSIVRNKGIVQGDHTIGIGFNSSDGTIGTDRDEDMNILYGTNLNLSSTSERIQVRKNSIWCTRFPLYNTNINATKIEVLVNSDTEFSGIASPGAEIYIYTDNSGCVSCNPKDFYTKILADAAGKWKLAGDLTGKKLVANATLINTSSEFTVPFLTLVAGKQMTAIQPACDKDDGSLRMNEMKHVLKIEWYNNSDQKIGEGMEVSKLAPGRYYAILSNGNCSLRTADVFLARPKIEVLDVQVDIKQPTCGLNNGYIKGLIVRSELPGTPNLEWRDKAGKTRKFED